MHNIKKIFLFISLLLLIFVFGCENNVDNNNSNDNNNNVNDNNNINPPVPNSTYKVTIIDNDDFIKDKKADGESYYSAGDIIKLHSDVIYDADLAMYVDGERIGIQNAIKGDDDRYIWEYQYTMPDHDITIEFKIESGKSENIIIDINGLGFEDFDYTKITKVGLERGYIGVAPGSEVYTFESLSEEMINTFIKVLYYEVEDVTDTYQPLSGGSYYKYIYYEEEKTYELVISNGYIWCNNYVYKVNGKLDITNCGY